MLRASFMVTSYRIRSWMTLFLTALLPSFSLAAKHVFEWDITILSKFPLKWLSWACISNKYCWYYQDFKYFFFHSPNVSHKNHSALTGPLLHLSFLLCQELPAAVVVEYWRVKERLLTSNPQVRDGEGDKDDIPVGDSSTLPSGGDIIFIFNSDVSQKKSVWIILKYYINTKA